MADLTEDVQRHVHVEADRVTYRVGYTAQIKQFHPLVTELTLESSVQTGETVETAVDRIRNTIDPAFLDAVREIQQEVEDIIKNGK